MLEAIAPVGSSAATKPQAAAGSARYYAYLCNAFDDATKHARGVRTDSPATSNKVFGVVRALQQAGARLCILSMGRGRQDVSYRRFAAAAKRAAGVPVLYAAFWHVPWITHLVTAFSVAALIVRLRRRGCHALVVYNRGPHFLAGVLIARLLGMRAVLDLEDGFQYRSDPPLQRWVHRFMQFAYDRLCNRGAILATSLLQAQTANTRTYVCHGVVNATRMDQDWTAPRLNVLYSGTLLEDRGARVLMRAIGLLQQGTPLAAASLRFIITGKGPMQEELAAFAASYPPASVVYYGALASAEYARVVRSAHVGLMLNLPEYEMSSTTFPSKVLEYAGNGALVAATNVSDVARLLDGGGLLLEPPNAPRLAAALAWIAGHRDEARDMAARGQRRVGDICASPRVGAELKCFLDAAFAGE